MPVPPCGLITLTTDFGLRDGYVAAMKGVILRIFPEARLVDVTHGITAGDILEASLVLGTCHRYFPGGSVHLGVVDPGVGGSRRPIVVAGEEQYFVGPDNGIFTGVLESEAATVVEIRDPRFLLPSVSNTFHGRDLFAPVAAYLARGIDPAEFGPVVRDPRMLGLPKPLIEEDLIRGEVVHVDHFGNLVTNVTRGQIESAVGAGRCTILIRDETIQQIRSAYCEQEPGRVVALFGSSDLLEIAVAGGRADLQIGADRGTAVVVRLARG
jgi:S-adenosylmethionine hydrolase